VGVAARPARAVLGSAERLVDDLDLGQVPARDAVDLLRVFDRLSRVADAARSLVAGQVAQSSLWKKAGHRSPAHWVAKECGIGIGDAVKLLETAQLAQEAPQTRQAMTAGRLSPRQARAVGRAEKANPREAGRLVAAAPGLAVTDLEAEVNRVVAAASEETEAVRAERIRKARYLHTGTNHDGSGWGRWNLPPVEHAALMAAIEANQSDVFTEKRRNGEREPSHAYAADALARLARRSGPRANTSSTPRPATGTLGDRGDDQIDDDLSFAKVIVKVDLTALDRGHVKAGEVCEIAGHGPVGVSDAWRFIDGGAFVAAVATRGTEIEKLVHLGRKPSALQRTGLEWLHEGVCAVDGCNSTARLEVDHVVPWADSHRTDLRDLTVLCGHHHDLKTHHGHTLGPRLPTGRRRIVPPDGRVDDDHPPGDGHGTGQGDLFDTG
jgi:hypothetical protein